MHLNTRDAVVFRRQRLPAVLEHLDQSLAVALVLRHLGEEVAEHPVHEAAGGIRWPQPRPHPAFIH